MSVLDCTSSPDPTRGKLSLATRPDPKLTHEALWRAIDQAETDSGVARTIPPGWITLSDFIARESEKGRIWRRNAAMVRLAGMVLSGDLETRLVVHDGRQMRAWGLSASVEKGKGGEK